MRTPRNSNYLDPDAQVSSSIDLTEKLANMGRQDGLCGKNADLDPGGQIRVISAWACEERAGALVWVYASIVPPESEYEEMAQNLVWDFDNVQGEWDGDYWVISLGEVQIEINSVYSKGGVFKEDATVKAIYKAIFKDKSIKKFQDEMIDLYNKVSNHE